MAFRSDFPFVRQDATYARRRTDHFIIYVRSFASKVKPGFHMICNSRRRPVARSATACDRWVADTTYVDLSFGIPPGAQTLCLSLFHAFLFFSRTFIAYTTIILKLLIFRCQHYWFLDSLSQDLAAILFELCLCKVSVLIGQLLTRGLGGAMICRRLPLTLSQTYVLVWKV